MFQLTQDQQHALSVFCQFLQKPNEKYMIIDGAAGCGKSTLVAHLYGALQAHLKMYELLLCKKPDKGKFKAFFTATTNKAAVALREITGLETKTIHSLLGLKVQSDYDTGEVQLLKREDYALLYNHLIIIDEGSMIDDRLFKLIDETACDCKIVIIGDKYQLAPIWQKVSIMEKLNCTKVTLHKVMRHAGPILHTASIFRDVVETGIFSDIPLSADVIHVDGPTFQKLIDQAFTNKKYRTNKAKVLAWTNSRVQAYNQHIRSIKGYPELYQEGEIVFTNNPIIYGEGIIPTESAVEITSVSDPIEQREVTGYLLQLDSKISAFMPASAWEAKLRLKKAAQEKNWSEYFHIKDYWLDLRPAYASTVHKAQGSSYDTVFIDLKDIGKCNISSDVARMLYVSISRAVNKVVLYGDLPKKYRGAIAA